MLMYEHVTFQVLVLCFAIFLGGSWSPSSLNIGYSSSAPMPSYTYLSPLKHTGPMGPELKDVRVDADAYSTPNSKSKESSSPLTAHPTSINQSNRY